MCPQTEQPARNLLACLLLLLSNAMVSLITCCLNETGLSVFHQHRLLLKSPNLELIEIRYAALLTDYVTPRHWLVTPNICSRSPSERCSPVTFSTNSLNGSKTNSALDLFACSLQTQTAGAIFALRARLSSRNKVRLSPE